MLWPFPPPRGTGYVIPSVEVIAALLWHEKFSKKLHSQEVGPLRSLLSGAITLPSHFGISQKYYAVFQLVFMP